MCSVCQQYQIGYITLQQLYNALKPELIGEAPKQEHDTYTIEALNQGISDNTIDLQGDWHGTEPDGTPIVP